MSDSNNLYEITAESLKNRKNKKRLLQNGCIFVDYPYNIIEGSFGIMTIFILVSLFFLVLPILIDMDLLDPFIWAVVFFLLGLSCYLIWCNLSSRWGDKKLLNFIKRQLSGQKEFLILTKNGNFFTQNFNFAKEKLKENFDFIRDKELKIQILIPIDKLANFIGLIKARNSELDKECQNLLEALEGKKNTIDIHKGIIKIIES